MSNKKLKHKGGQSRVHLDHGLRQKTGVEVRATFAVLLTHILHLQVGFVEVF